jgi:hypothetical protein
MLSLIPLLISVCGVLQVQTRNMATAGDDGKWRKVGILVSNTGPNDVSLDTSKIQYVMHEKTLSLNTPLWYCQIHDTTWQYSVEGTNLAIPALSQLTDTTVVLIWSFNRGYKIPVNGKMELQFGISRTDYSVIDQTLDPSYVASTTFTSNPIVPFQSDFTSTYAARTTPGIYGTVVPCCVRK